MADLFRFKQFEIDQSNCAMKVGTDAVILGAWTSIEHNPTTILDIGAGTGILSLMLAQRSWAKVIDAIEIDDKAYEQCVENFEDSEWSNRLFCYHASLEEFNAEIEDTYDLIICNPPFFETPLNVTNDSLKESRAKARYTHSLSFESLFQSVSNLLDSKGIFSTVIPYSEESKIIKLAKKFKLFPGRVLNVRGNSNTELKRSLIEFSFQDKQNKTKELIIETDRHVYTDDHIALTKEFYLKM